MIKQWMCSSIDRATYPVPEFCSITCVFILWDSGPLDCPPFSLPCLLVSSLSSSCLSIYVSEILWEYHLVWLGDTSKSLCSFLICDMKATDIMLKYCLRTASFKELSIYCRKWIWATHLFIAMYWHAGIWWIMYWFIISRFFSWWTSFSLMQSVF